jgi:glycosyltransferase involved in cell wall biosynthesis
MSVSAPLHVLHVTYDMRIGGTEQVIRNLVEASDPHSTRMSIFCVEEPLGPWGEELRAKGTDIYSCARQPGFDLRVLGALRECLRKNQVDVVHCHQYTPWVYGALASLGLGQKVIFTEHGRFYPDSASPKRRFINPLLAHITDHVTAISQATKQALVDYEYLPANRIRVVYNGIRGLKPQTAASSRLRKGLKIPDGAPVLGSIARFDPIKNHSMMLKAFRIVLDRHPEVRLLLVGDGEERSTIYRIVEELGLTERVVLPGYIPEPALWLEAMDVFLLSSFSEGTSMTLLEAMSLGKPCVVTDVGGNPEIVIAEETGKVTPSDDADAFALAIEDMLGQLSSGSQNLHQRATERFQAEFTSHAMVDKYMALYQSVA